MAKAFPANPGYQKSIRPGFVVDVLSRDHLLPGGIKIDAVAFNSEDAVKVTVGTGGAAANATTVPVTALPEEVPSGAIIQFGAANSTKFARTSAVAAKGATSVAVQPLPTAVVAGDIGYYNAPGQPKRIASGTLVGLTIAEYEGAGAAGVKWGPAADADDYVRIMAFDIPNADEENDADLLRVGTGIKVNFLPSWAGASTTLKTKIRAAYEVTVGAPGDEVAAV